jgi:hypothetical protein
MSILDFQGSNKNVKNKNISKGEIFLIHNKVNKNK